jgi:hypothetical protein
LFKIRSLPKTVEKRLSWIYGENERVSLIICNQNTIKIVAILIASPSKINCFMFSASEIDAAIARQDEE